jgi:general secretion pathway protein K
MKRRRDRGIALLLSLLVLTILIVLIAQMSLTSAQNKAISENYLNDLQNSLGARSGYIQALLYLQADSEKSPNTDTLREKWAAPLTISLGRATVSVTIEDCERRINLSQIQKDNGETNPVVVAQVKRLVSILGHDPEVALRIIDYIDADTKGDFEANARNARLYTIDEILRIDGIPREALYGGEVDGRKKKGLLDFVTIWPKAGSSPPEPGSSLPGAINVNTAPLEVLRALSDSMSETLAQAIIDYRETKGNDGAYQEFKTVNDLKKVSGMTDEIYADIQNQIVVRGGTFEIRSKSSVGNISRAWLYIVKRTTGQQGAITLLASQRLNDFLSVKPPEQPKP